MLSEAFLRGKCYDRNPVFRANRNTPPKIMASVDFRVAAYYNITKRKEDCA